MISITGGLRRNLTYLLKYVTQNLVHGTPQRQITIQSNVLHINLVRVLNSFLMHSVRIIRLS